MRSIAILAVAFLLPTAGAEAASLQPIGSFEQPTYITSSPADPELLFVTERLGTIELVDEGSVSTFADLTSLVGCSSVCAGERGLMSMALAPDFADSGHLYVDYINNSSGQIHVDELTATGDVAPLSSLRPVLTINHAEASNHNGGQLQFGPDGDLYISTGDGGGGNDEFHHSQDMNSLLGKLLRIDPHQSGAQPYTVPAGNPFPTATAPADTIWSYGLRNPFRFSFDRLNGDLVIGDVGQGTREEVDYAPRGQPARSAAPAPTTAGTAVRASSKAQPTTSPKKNARRRASSIPSSTTHTRAAPARSSAATSCATKASATSTGATCTPTSASGTSAPYCCRRARAAWRAVIAPRASQCPNRTPSVRTPAAASTSSPVAVRSPAWKAPHQQAVRHPQSHRAKKSRGLNPLPAPLQPSASAPTSTGSRWAPGHR